jgi:hypothetical protein
MALPRHVTKGLVQRIIPELLEEDIAFSRPYVEQLANIVQRDRMWNIYIIFKCIIINFHEILGDVLLEFDIQPTFEYLAVKLILDQDRNPQIFRGNIPYTLNFLFASVTLRKCKRKKKLLFFLGINF